MKQLVVLSGKGGTGKTCVAASLAHLVSQSHLADDIVLADVDVDAANLELLLRPRVVKTREFRGGNVAVIDDEVCTDCGRCEQLCRFDAVHYRDDRYVVDPIACDGCAACLYQCPVGCITMREELAGRFYLSESRYGPLYHAALFPGRENSGKLVTLVKQGARQHLRNETRSLLLSDGPPGIGCPVISATTGADFALIVSESTIAGVQDMYRAVQTVDHFGAQAIVCINKADIYPEATAEIEEFCSETGIDLVGEIPFDPVVPAAMVAGVPVTAFRSDAPASIALAAMWGRIVSLLQELP